MKNTLLLAYFIVMSLIPFSLMSMDQKALQARLVAQLQERVLIAQKFLKPENPKPFGEIIATCQPARFKRSEVSKKVIVESTSAPLKVIVDSIKTEVIMKKTEPSAAKQTVNSLKDQNKKDFTDLDELLASLDEPVFSKISMPTQDSPIERISLAFPAVDITQKIQDLQQQFIKVSQYAEVFSSNDPKISDDFTYELQTLDKLTDNLVPFLQLKSENEKIPALSRLKSFVATTHEQNVKIPQNNKKVARMTAFNAYMASLECLKETLALAK